MTSAYLQVTYKKGRPFAAYYYLPRHGDERSHRTQVAAPGLIIDFNRAGTPIGIEIVNPLQLELATFNRVLRSLGFEEVSNDELKALHAA